MESCSLSVRRLPAGQTGASWRRTWLDTEVGGAHVHPLETRGSESLGTLFCMKASHLRWGTSASGGGDRFGIILLRSTIPLGLPAGGCSRADAVVGRDRKSRAPRKNFGHPARVAGAAFDCGARPVGRRWCEVCCARGQVLFETRQPCTETTLSSWAAECTASASWSASAESPMSGTHFWLEDAADSRPVDVTSNNCGIVLTPAESHNYDLK